MWDSILKLKFSDYNLSILNRLSAFLLMLCEERKWAKTEVMTRRAKSVITKIWCLLIIEVSSKRFEDFFSHTNMRWALLRIDMKICSHRKWVHLWLQYFCQLLIASLDNQKGKNEKNWGEILTWDIWEDFLQSEKILDLD